MLSYRLITRPLVLLTSIIVLSACSSDSNNAPPIDTSLSLHEQLQIVVDDAVRSGLPGVSLHVQDRGENISVVAGVVNQDTAEPVTPSSLFHAASLGKPFMATMFLRLVEMGFLQLDDSIEYWLDPSMSAMISNSDEITVEMLLAHTSGIPDYHEDFQFGIDLTESKGKIWTPIEVLGYIVNTENHFEPAAEFRYSNTNFVLLGVIAERVTGLPLGMALRQWVFEPAGLENTFGAYEYLGQPEIAHGYVPVSYFDDVNPELDVDIDLPMDGSDLDTVEWLITNGRGDAPIHSSPSDLNSFIRILIDTDTLLSEELKTRMLTDSHPGGEEHGLGMFIIDNGATFEHNGHYYGVLASMSYTPAEDLSIATAVNGSLEHYHDLFGQYLNRIYSVIESHR